MNHFFMKLLSVMTLLFSAAVAAEEGKRSGHATAQWLVPEESARGGASYQTVIRLVVDHPWHVYWHNPGEAGMPTSVDLEMPEGWQAHSLQHPTPKRFLTGGLHGFGHEGTVDYLLTFQLPEDFEGDAEVKATVAWLTCNDEACVPGEMPLVLKLEDGKPVVGKVDSAAVAAAANALPLEAPDEVALKLERSKDHWQMTIENPGLLNLDVAQTKVFVETTELVDSSADLKFSQVGELWQGKFPKSEFADDFAEECAILLVQEGKRAVRVEQ